MNEAIQDFDKVIGDDPDQGEAYFQKNSLKDPLPRTSEVCKRHPY